MISYKIINIKDNPALKQQAAAWYHEKWHIPESTYLESIDESLNCENAVPQWYLVLSETSDSTQSFDSRFPTPKIIGGLGVISNDFHNRKDLSPNVCAVFVEPEYRNKGIAGMMLNHVCSDMSEKGIDTLYLITDHTSFYERYGWNFLCMVQGDGEPELTRLYIHQNASGNK